MQTKHSPSDLLTTPLKRLPGITDDETATASVSVGAVRGGKKLSGQKRGSVRIKGPAGKLASKTALVSSEVDIGSVINGDFDLSTVQLLQPAPAAAMGHSKQKILDEALLEMIAVDFHPLSIVEDRGFRKFVGKLQPLYKLPTRQSLFESLLQQQFVRAVNERRVDVHQATAICLSAEGWLSQTSERYVALTAHFLSPQLEAKACLLDCFIYSDQHTVVNVKDDLVRIVEEWGISQKVMAVVTDASPNLAAAVGLIGWPNLPCFAHMLNSMAQEAMKEIVDLRAKVRAAINYFQTNSIGSEMLKNVLAQMQLPNRDLIQDSPGSRWTTTFCMFQRLLELREPILSSLALLVETVPDMLSDVEWEVVSHVCELMRPMFEVTCELSAERYAPASKIILMARGLSRLCRDHYASSGLSQIVLKMAGLMLNSMLKWFSTFETNNLLAEATLLDPRFKRSGFVDENAAEQAIVNVTTAAGRGGVNSTEENIAYNVTVTEPDGTVSTQMPVSLPPSSSIWSDYDQRVYIIVAAQSPAAEAQAQMRQFLEEPLLPRQESCLEWWQSRAAIYPRLIDVVRERLCIVATSAPCDRMYSKTGSVLMDRRSRLDQSEVRQLVFLNANMIVS